MKAERRHELKHNALDAELVKIIDYLKKHFMGIILAILAIVAAISIGWAVIRNRAAAVSVPSQEYAQLKRLDTSTADGRSNVLAGFEKLSTQTGNPQIAAMACVEAGDISVRQQLAGDFVSGALDKARKYYQRVLDDFEDNPVAAGRAHLGLARLAEGKRDFAAAREQYQQVVGLGDRTSLMAMNTAKSALTALADLAEPIHLATTRPARPTPMPTTKPTTRPAAKPTTRPTAKPTAKPTIKPAIPPTTQPATAPAVAR